MEPYRDPGMQAGTITALTVQRHQPTRVLVFLDGVFAFGIAQDLVREWGLGVGRCLRVEDQMHLRAADQLLAAQVCARPGGAARCPSGESSPIPRGPAQAGGRRRLRSEEGLEALREAPSDERGTDADN